MVECEASTFPLVNPTQVSTAAHSTQYFGLLLLNGLEETFWRLSFPPGKHLPAPSGAGLIFTPVPASPASTAGGGDSPSYSGFFHCLAVFDDRSSPCLTQAAVYCSVYGIPSHGSFIPCCFGSSRATTFCLCF